MTDPKICQRTHTLVSPRLSRPFCISRIASPLIALLDQLRHNTDRDLARLISTNVETYRAVKCLGPLLHNANCGEFLQKNRPLCFAADDTQKRKLPILTEDFLQDRAIGGVAH